MPPIDYIHIEAGILTRQDLSDKSKMLLGLIQSFNSKGLMMSNPALAKMLCCSADHIGRLLKELVKSIRIENPQSRYRKIFYSGQNVGVDTKLLRPKCRSKKDSTPAIQTSTPACAQSTPAKMPDITKRTKGTKHSEGGDVSKSFDVFWVSYPKKAAKQDALKAFSKLNPDDALLGVMLTALERHKVSDQWSKDGGRYIPYPATWLNGRRWEDKLTIDGDCPQSREITETEADELFKKAGMV